MAVLLFMSRFHEPIRSGRKRQTIRRTRKRPIQIDEPLSLRYWTGAAYRSKQETLLETKCVGSFNVNITWDFDEDTLLIRTTKAPLTHREANAFARNDGFESLEDMAKFWRDVHGMGNPMIYEPEPFVGQCILW